LDVICLGEVLIDLIGQEISDLPEVETFKRFPGGAAGNVAVGVSKLNLDSGFIGKVGEDPFGEFLINTLKRFKVDVSQIYKDRERRTGLAFVSLDKKGVPDYLFYRNPSASMFLSPEEIKESYIKEGKALYFSSMSLVNEPFRSANYRAIELANKYNLTVLFDPNIRISLWSSKEKAKEEIEKVLGYIDILKLNIDELKFLAGEDNPEEGCRELLKRNSNLQLIALTMGEKGSLLIDSRGESAVIEAFAVEVKDTTGAGDAFTSALLAQVLENRDLDRLRLKEIGKYANAAAALAIQKPGVIPALPYKRDIKSFLNLA